MLIEEGQRVNEGDLLARLDDTEAKAQLSLTRAQLEAARSQVAEIRANLVQAERDYERQSQLFKRELVAGDLQEAPHHVEHRLLVVHDQDTPAGDVLGLQDLPVDAYVAAAREQQLNRGRQGGEQPNGGPGNDQLRPALRFDA